MKKFFNVTTVVVMLCMLATMACACSGNSNEEEAAGESVVTDAAVTEEALSPTIVSATEAQATATTAAAAEETTAATTAATTEATTEATTAATTQAATDSSLTDEMILDAIHNYCVIGNTEFAELGGDHWIIESSNDTQVVVLFTSYTGSENRYYVDRATGSTTVTELVPGIIDEEQSTGETFNARDHIAAEIYR